MSCSVKDLPQRLNGKINGNFYHFALETAKQWVSSDHRMIMPGTTASWMDDFAVMMGPSWAWWYLLITLATWESEAGGSKA